MNKWHVLIFLFGAMAWHCKGLVLLLGRYDPEEFDSHLTFFYSDGIQMTSEVNSDFIEKVSESRGRNVGTMSTKDSLDEYVSMESLAPLAMQKIETLAWEGLKIQSSMADEDAPCYVDPLPSVEFNYGNTHKGGGLAVMDGVASTHKLVFKDSDENPIQTGGILASAISLERWMELDMAIANEADQNENTHTVKVAHQSNSHWIFTRTLIQSRLLI